MSDTKGLRPAYFGPEVEGIPNSVGKSLYKKISLVWSKPQIFNGEDLPFFEDRRPLLYAITRDHHRKLTRNEIAYVGLSLDPQNRFRNHPKAQDLALRRGDTALSHAYLDLGRSSRRLDSVKSALEEIEHILIWALWRTLENEKKQFTLPGMGTNPGQAWHILNEGFRFSGLMPREIVYPWMLIRPGRDRSAKA